MGSVTTTQALKKLYKKLIGDETQKNSPTKIIDDLAGSYVAPKEPEEMYAYSTSSSSISLTSANGEGSLVRAFTVKTGYSVGANDANKIRAFIDTPGSAYPLIITKMQTSSGIMTLTFKSLLDAPSSSSPQTLTGKVRILAPFEISSDQAVM